MDKRTRDDLLGFSLFGALAAFLLLVNALL